MSKEKQNGTDISRRDFVKTGATAGLGVTALAGLVSTRGERPR